MTQSRRQFGTIFRRRYRRTPDGPVKLKPGFYVRFQRDGKSVQRGPFGTERDADAYLARTYAAILKAEATGVRPLPKTTFEAFWPTFCQRVSRRRKESTKAMDEMRWHGVLRPFWGGKVLSEVRREEVEDWLALRERGGAPGPEGSRLRAVGKATLNRDLSFLSVIFTYAADAGLVRSNPCKGIKRSREKEHAVLFLSAQDVARIVQHAEPAVGAAVRFLAETGLRRGEAEALRWVDMDEQRRVVVVRDSKNSTSREVPWTKAVEAVVFDLKVAAPGPLHDVLPVLSELSRSQFDREFRKAVKLADLPHVRVHDLRHHFGTSLVRAGVPLPDVQRLMGHKTLQTTLRYACHQPADAGSRAIEALDRSRSGGEIMVPGMVHPRTESTATDASRRGA